MSSQLSGGIYNLIEKIKQKMSTIFFKVVILMENLEKYVFWTSDNEKLYNAKQELISLVNRFPIHITAKGFFNLDRRFLAAVCFVSTFHI